MKWFRFLKLNLITATLAMVVLCEVPASAQQGPSQLNISGGLFNSSGQPITSSNVRFKIDIYDKDATCLMYTEQHTGVDLSNTRGAFSLIIGSGTSAVNNLEGTTAFDAKIFQNSGAVAPFTGCGSGLTLSPGDTRLIRVSYDTGSGLVAMTPDIPITSSAYAMVAETLQGKSASDFILTNVNTSLSQTNVDYIFSNVNYPNLKALVDGTSSQYIVSNPSAAVGFNGQRLINVGTPTGANDAANKTYVDGSVGGKGVDFSAVGPGIGGGRTIVWDQAQNKWVTSSTGSVGLVAAGTGLTGGNITASGTLSVDVGVTANKILQLDASARIPAVDGSLLTNVNAMYLQGRMVSVGTPSALQVLGWNDVSSMWEPQTPTGGTVTGLSGDVAGSGSGVISTTIQANAVTSAKINNTGVAVNRLLITDATTGAAVGYATCALGEVMQWTASGWACKSVALMLGNSGVTAGTYGNSIQVPQIGVDSSGRVTSLTNVNIAFPVISVAGRTGAVTLTATDVSGLGTAATKNVGTGLNEVLQFTTAGQLPAVDGSLLTNVNAISLQGTAVSATPPNDGQVLAFNNLTSKWEAKTAAVGSVTSVSAGAGLNGGTITSTGTLSVDVGVTANKILQLDSSARIPAVDGSLLTNLSVTSSQWTSLNSDIYYNSGSVGIGTSAPTDRLEVAGGIRFNSTPYNSAGIATTLNGGITAAATSINLTSTAGFPPAGRIVLVGSGTGEVASYTSISGNTLNGVTRGLDGTTAGSALTGTPVTYFLLSSGNYTSAGPAVWLDSVGVLSLGASQWKAQAHSNHTSAGLMIGANTDIGAWSVAVGNGAGATGQQSIAVGISARAMGLTSQAFGTSVTANSFAQHTVGQYNLPKGSENANAWVLTDPLFVVGNGTGAGALSNAMMILKNGNVGLGTTTPGYNLDVAGAINASSILVNGVPVGTGSGSVSNISSGTGLIGGPITTTGTLNVDVGVTANKILQLNASAQIPAVDGSLLTSVNAAKIGGYAIATTSPGAGQYIGWNNSTSSWEPTATTTGTVTNIATSTGLTGGTISSTGTLAVDVGVTANKIVQLDGSARLPAVDGSQLTNLSLTSSQWTTLGANVYYNIGNVGIGTATPGAKLDVIGNVSIDGNLWSSGQIEAAGAYIGYTNTGGLANPLAVYNNASASAGVGTTYEFKGNGGTLMGQLVSAWNGASNSNSYLAFTNRTSGSVTEKMRITSAGNVGIGTTTPGYNLDVVGAINASSVLVNGVPVGTGSGSVTNISAGTGLTGGNISTAGTLNVDVGVTANQILQLNASAQIPAVDGSLLTSVNAAKIGGYAVATTSPSAGQYIGWNNSTSSWEPTATTTGTVTNIATGTGLTGGPISSTGTLAVDVGVTANKIVQLDGSARLPAVDGSLLTNLGLTSSQWTTLGSNVYYNIGNVGIGTTTPNYELDVAGTINASSILVNGVPVGTGSGSVTNVSAGTGLTGGNISSTGTLNVDVGTTANKILQLTSSAQIPAVDGSLLTSVNAAKIGGYAVATTSPTSGQYIGWNNSTGSWEPTATTSGTVTNIATGTGLTGGPITSNGTLTVDVGVTANKIVQLDSSARLPAVDGSLLTNLGLTSSQWTTLGSNVYYNIGNVGIGTMTPGYNLDVVGAINASAMLVNGVPVGTGSGSVTNISAGTGLTGGSISTTGTLNVDVGTTANKILQLNSSAQIPAVDSSLLTNVNAAKIGGYAVATTSPSAGQYIGWNNSTSSWEPTATTTGTVTNIATGTGLTGGPISSTGTLAIDVGITANKIVQLDSSARLPAVDGSLLTNLSVTSSQWTTSSPNIYYNLGNVGIGTTSPSSALEVNGVARVGDGTLAAPSLSFASATGTGMYMSGSTMMVASGGVARLALDTRLSGVVAGTPYMVLNVGGGLTYPTYAFYGDQNTGMYSPAADNLSLVTGGVERIRMDANGYVGIGTTTPAAALQVVGTVKASFIDTPAIYSNGIQALQTNTVASGVNYITVTPAAAGSGPILSTSGSDATVALNMYTKGGGSILLAPGQAPAFKANFTSGAVNFLQANGAATGSAPTLSAGGTDTNVDIKITPRGTGNTLITTGNLGIGTTTPQAVLDIQTTTSGQSAILVPRDTTANRPSGTNGMIRYNTSTNSFEAYSNGGWTALTNARRTCIIDNDTQSATALTAAQFSGRCVIPANATIVEVAVLGGTGVVGGTLTATGTGSINLQKVSGGSATNILSGNLATASGKACALTSTSGTCSFNAGMTSSASITISTTALAAGDYIQVSAATPDSTQTWYTIAIIYTVN